MHPQGGGYDPYSMGQYRPTTKGVSRGPESDNRYEGGNLLQRMIVPAKAVGSLIGRGGSKAKAIRSNNPDARVCIDGEDWPERLVTISGYEIVHLVAVTKDICSYLGEDVGHETPAWKRLPKIMGRGQRRPMEREIQLQLLISEHDVDCVIGPGNCKSEKYFQETGCQAYVWHQYLPASNEKILTLTGLPEKLPNAMNKVLNFLCSAGGANGPNRHKHYRSWNVEIGGPCWFYDRSKRERMRLAGCVQAEPTGMINMPIAGLNPFIQTVDVQRCANGSARIMANMDQAGIIMGQHGTRVKEIRRMTGSVIRINDLKGDSCLREILVDQATQGNDNAVENSIWLMNISINAFVEPSGSACAFTIPTTLQEVVLSEAYGKPPGHGITEYGNTRTTSSAIGLVKPGSDMDINDLGW